jgi:hypothetical protein
MSQIHFYCVFCGSGIDADPAQARKSCICPKCSRVTPVPVLPRAQAPSCDETYPPGIFSVEIKFACPECGGRLGMDVRNTGEAGLCPICYRKILCPDVSVLTAPSPGAVPAPKEVDRTIIHLSREEINFLSQLESYQAKPVHHAS